MAKFSTLAQPEPIQILTDYEFSATNKSNCAYKNAALIVSLLFFGEKSTIVFSNDSMNIINNDECFKHHYLKFHSSIIPPVCPLVGRSVFNNFQKLKETLPCSYRKNKQTKTQATIIRRFVKSVLENISDSKDL